MKATEIKSNKGVIGGTDIAAILGISEFKTPHEAWERILLKKEIEANRSMIRGTKIEPFIADFAKDDYGFKYEAFQQRIQKGVAAGTIDAIGTDENGNKTIFEFKSSVMIKDTQDIPADYKTQCYWYMGLYGASRCNLIIMDGFFNLKRFVIDYRKDVFDAIDLRAGEWYEKHIINEIPPELVTREIIDMYKKVEDVKGIMSAKNISKEELIQYFETKRKIKELEDEITKIEDKIKEEIKDNEGIQIDNMIVTWKPQKKETVDTAMLKNDYPDVYEKVKKVTTYRVLRSKILKQ